jgi:hypothetical protein
MRIATLLLITVVVLTPDPAAAQLGGLVKRGASRAAEKAVDKAVDKTVADKTPAKDLPASAFDDEVLELSSARVDQVVRGLTAWNEARAKADVAGATKAYEASTEKEQEFSNKYSDQRHAFRTKNDKVEQCRDEVFDAQREANQAEIDRKMANIQSDPARMQAMTAKATEWSLKLQKVMSSGDTVAARAAMLQYQAEMAKAAGVVLDTDSTKADAKCGKPAAPPSWLVEWDSTEVRTRRLGERVREAEGAGEKEAVAASGLTARQFAIARERIESFVTDGGMAFTKKERAVLAPRKAELKAHFAGK